MNFYYDVFLPLCNSVEKAPSKVAVELKCSKSMVSNWKKRGTWPTPANLAKIEEYFGVTISEETGIIKKPATKSGDGSDIVEVIRLYTNAPAAVQNSILALLRAAESSGAIPGDDSKDQ